MKLNISLAVFAFFLGSFTASPQEVLVPARIRCNAAFSAPCSRTNSQYLAMDTAKRLRKLLPQDYISDIIKGDYNMTVGFYPFVFERGNNSTVCAAHGADKSLVGLTLEDIFAKNSIRFSDANALYDRFELAAQQDSGDWVTYLWSDGGSTNSKVAFVTAIDQDYFLGVGYEDVQLPPELPCSAQYDGWCSINNVRSLVGKAQFRLYKAASLENFESVVFDLSFLEQEFEIPGDFYTFMYNYDGRLKAHARPLLHEQFDNTLPDIFQNLSLGSRSEGLDLHETFKKAAEGNGWVQYQWRNIALEDPYTKIAKLVKVKFDGEEYYVGSGFNFAVNTLPEGPLGEACSANYNLPCAFSAAFQLSSHVLAFAVSSPLPVPAMFDEISYNGEFKTDNADFYVFVYDYNERCQAHGSNSSFLGKTLTQVFELVEIDLNATVLHQQFRDAAEQGGGWVLYDWVDAGGFFQKISYIFSMNLDGKDYYGGIGFNHRRAPVKNFTEKGFKKNGLPIECSPEYGWECSEQNARAILGQAVTDLTLVSSDIQRATLKTTINDVLSMITAGDDEYRVNNFTVSVFSESSNICGTDDLSGCCIASGGDPSQVAQTWQEILDAEGITSVRGSELHRDHLNTAIGIGGMLKYQFHSGTEVLFKRAWVSKFRSAGENYYVVASYLTTDPPDTCDDCPDTCDDCDKECISENQSFCTIKPDPEPRPIDYPLFKPFIGIICVAFPLVLFLFYRQRQKKRKYREDLRKQEEENERVIKQLEQQMQGMVEVIDDLPAHSVEDYNEKQQQGQERAFWYWEESSNRVESHKASMILAGTSFVRYSRDVSDQMEHSYQLFKEGRGFRELRLDLTGKITSTIDGKKADNANSGMHYDLDFETMMQKNCKTEYKRNLCRKESELHADVQALGGLPPLPEDINFVDNSEEEGERLLPTYKGQVIQVTKAHPDGDWLYGNVLDDPLLNDAKEKNQQQQQSGLNTVLAHALHDRPMSGWFPRVVAQTADHEVMQRIMRSIGGGEGVDSLTPPETWTIDARDSSAFMNGRIDVPIGSREYNEVVNYFTDRLYGQKNSITVTNVERIQNLPLWQSYAVKKQTIKQRYIEHPEYRVHNRDNVEYKLFHGTHPEVIPKIEKQGFNRAFAGRNAVRYGKGVYFARDSAYSCHRSYSTADENAIQRMFVCRVVVGDWCKGSNEQLAPDAKPHNPFELYETTVDNVTNPSIFVVYHDAQCYPEYLVSFKSS